MADDVKTDAKHEVDDKGVPIENRIKEMERKLTEKHEKEMAQIRAELAQSKLVPEEEVKKPALEELTKAELMRFVADPKGYVAYVQAEQQAQREMAEVKPWLQKQEGYDSEDDARLIAIEAEYQLAHPSPLMRAHKAWTILQAEKLLAKSQETSADAKRENAVKKSIPEGGGKSMPKETGGKRADLLRQLAESESKGDIDRSIQLVNRLEDIRE